MRTVKIHKNNKNILKSYGDGSFDELVVKLLNDVEDDLPIVDVDYSTVTSMRLNESTVDRLESYRLTDGESYENIIVRMLLLSKTINTDEQ